MIDAKLNNVPKVFHVRAFRRRGRHGQMARMNTSHPVAVVRFKQWMSKLSARDPLKRRSDALQASVVDTLLRDHLTHLAQP